MKTTIKIQEINSAGITAEQVAIVRPEWDAMKEFLGLPPDTDTAPQAAAEHLKATYPDCQWTICEQ